MGKQILLPPQPVPLDKKIVFLAGPVSGALSWRYDFIELLNTIEKDFIIASPQHSYPEYTQDVQIAWEEEAMNAAFNRGVLVFYLAAKEYEPRYGRSYARTTRFELGEYYGRLRHEKGNVLIYADQEFDGWQYIIKRFRWAYGDDMICSSVSELLQKISQLL